MKLGPIPFKQISKCYLSKKHSRHTVHVQKPPKKKSFCFKDNLIFFSLFFLQIWKQLVYQRPLRLRWILWRCASHVWVRVKNNVQLLWLQRRSGRFTICRWVVCCKGCPHTLGQFFPTGFFVLVYFFFFLKKRVACEIWTLSNVTCTLKTKTKKEERKNTHSGIRSEPQWISFA